MDSPESKNRASSDVGFTPVLIIGAGASGIAMAYQLKHQLGYSDFRVVERQSGIGGSWWSNRYPGACDVPTASYSFSFAPYYTSTRLYPTGDEFQKYLESVAKRFKLSSKIEFDTEVSSLRWIESDSQWEATLTHFAPGIGDLSTRERDEKIAKNGALVLRKETIRARAVVSCVGILVEPNPWPSSIPGRDNFKGPVFHTARWNADVDLDGKNVVVIGAGCSAAQVVPSLLVEPYNVKSVTQIMRQAPWVMPRLEEPFGKEKFAKYAPTVLKYFPILGWMYRMAIHWLVELILATVIQAKNVKWRKGLEASTLKRTLELIPEKYHTMMTPDYPYGCKRRVFDSDWLMSMNKPNFALENRKITAVHEQGLTLGAPYNKSTDNTNEKNIPADVIILANGFEATRWLHPLSVVGRNGSSLQDTWNQRGGPQAYMGIAIDGFPNFFIAMGPNSANGTHSLILTSENMAIYIAKTIRPLLEGDVTTIEVKKEAVSSWTQEIKQGLLKTVFVGCTSWYMDKEGYNSTLYP
ncbi:FAD/NAD(P)-binding domain-containing protein [Periconia macrospinosa]|uniref:FAD/NAD(P)-binding domain-containing protein n=1 Tax=Periconia macrospinosa TaxID=97972 RepID=A0A2V1D8M8_9PLEO|nr:FAD/NAD(P)-binding domain-containing protein [Periconia macrospinosa]